jgi:hypothetical protein
MKFSKFILAFAASFLILSQAGAATIVGNLMDIYGGGIDRTIKISPKSTPQAVIYNGTNYTVMDLAKTVSSTNSVFAVVLLGGIYNVDFGTVNGVATPVTKILVPPYDTNTYAFNYVANLATNLGTFVWTNSYGIAAGTNIVITTNGALLVINASAPAAAVPTNFASITVTNDINRGDASDTGKSLNISLGGSAATSPGVGGDGGTVNIASGVNGNGLAGLGGNGGTVTIAQGGTSGLNAVLGGNGGTVNIANASPKGTAGTVNIATNGSTYVGNLTIQSNLNANGNIRNTNGTLNINQNLGNNTGNGINIQADDSPDSSAGGVTILGGNASDSNGGGILIKAGNGNSIGGDVTILAGTNSTSPNTANSISLKSYSAGYGISGQIDIAGSTIFSSNVYLAQNLYVTNHAYDVSTSRLDPLANEFVTAEYVQSVMAANFDLYFSTNSSGVFITNVGTPSTMVLVNPTTSQTNTISSFTNGTYFTARLQTNSISYIQSVPINLYTYVQVTGGGSITAHPEMWLYNTNGTIVQLGYSSDNTYSSSIAVPVNLAIAMTNTAYLNVNLTNSPQLLLRWYVTSTSGNPTWKFLIGAGNVSHITVGTIPSANQNYVGTFTGNGTGLTNIPSTGITGLGTAAYSNSTAFASSTVTNLTAGQLATIAAAVTNNASPTFTGLAVGAQTALDVNGNGKFGGVGLTNGVLTGNGSGITNVTTEKVSLTPPYGGLDNNVANLGLGVRYTYGQGGSQSGYFSLNPMMFNQSTTATKLVIAVPLFVTNAIQTVVWQSLYVSNNVAINVQPTVSYTTLTASNQNWIFITNNIGNITNLSSFWFAPYQDTPANRAIWVRTSIHAYLIP